MSKKQLFNKKESFSIRKYSFGVASILVGSLLFLGGGPASAAETTEATTHETTSIEHIQLKQESTSTQEGSNTKEISTTQEPSTTGTTSNTQETPSTQEVKSTEETPSSQETTSTEETPSSEESQSNTITTREEPSTEQPSSTKDIHTKETFTTETSKAHATQQSIKTQPETSQQPASSTDTKAQSSTPSKSTSTKKETTPSSTKETSTQEQLSTQKSQAMSHKSVVQSPKEDNVMSAQDNISTNSNQIPAQLAPKADTTSTVASTSESKVNIQDVPKTEFKNLTSNEKEVLYQALQQDANTQNQQPKAILSTTPMWTSAQRAKNASRTGQDQLNVTHTGRYTSGSDFGNGGTEIVKYNPTTGDAYSINGDKEALDIIDAAHPNEDGTINLKKRIYLQDNDIEAGDVTSVVVHPGGDYFAVSAPAVDKTQPGIVAFYDKDGNYLNHVTVGSLPDMVTFSKDGKYVLVANEGEPNDDYTVNPEGSVSVIDVTSGPSHLSAQDIRTVSFTKEHQKGLRALGPNAKDAYLNIEPEYIAVDNQSKYAYVTLQEVSAIAKIDIANASIVDVKALPYKDHSFVQNSMDTSDKDGKTELPRVPVLGLLQPDGIETYEYNGETYLVIANEGDSQDYKGYAEETRVKKIKNDIQLDATYYQGYTQEELDDMVKNGLFNDDQLGRLKVTTDQPFKDENGTYHALISYGGRSFSILRESDLDMIYDSGNDIEQRILELLPERFNADYKDYNDIEVDGRSDDKGPEVENVVVGQVGSHSYAFVGLERVGGIMIYDITNPYEPYFVKYLYDPDNKDISPEGITFESAEESPNGKPLLIASFEVSGTTSTWELDDLLSENEDETSSDDIPDDDTSKENDDTSNIDDNHASDVDGNQSAGDIASSKNNGETEEMASPVKDETNQSDTITIDNAHSQKLTHHSDDMNQSIHSSHPHVEDNTQHVHRHNMKHESTQSGDTREMKGKYVNRHMNNAKHTHHHQHELHHEHTQPMAMTVHTVDAINNSTSAMHSMKHVAHKDHKHVQHLPQTGQHDTTTTLWSVLAGGLGLAFLRKRKTSKITK
ncbi:choice-of-anchor I family protein [Staphylococcus hominis]|uniref:choice-of-anchor I family protein n=1 Tax=Staphylococcus hominis TaxID=1290 RepID=UPI001F55F12F|nr:choice-of-anchor I family protein [Staphylococcus hominis]MCI2901763.1 choice-of-anchor I family protein [Staphylococcus hominis]